HRAGVQQTAGQGAQHVLAVGDVEVGEDHGEGERSGSVGGVRARVGGHGPMMGPMPRGPAYPGLVRTARLAAPAPPAEPQECPMPAPRDTAVVVRAARLYYEQGRSQTEVAQELGLSRSNVSRILTQARDRGIVEITIHDPEGPPRRDEVLEAALRA